MINTLSGERPRCECHECTQARYQMAAQTQTYDALVGNICASQSQEACSQSQTSPLDPQQLINVKNWAQERGLRNS